MKEELFYLRVNFFLLCEASRCNINKVYNKKAFTKSVSKENFSNSIIHIYKFCNTDVQG